jgi:hypothetical protein
VYERVNQADNRNDSACYEYIREYIQKFPDWIITKYTLITINTRWEATQRALAAKLTRLTHRIAIQLHLVEESCTIFSSRSRRLVRKLLNTPSYILEVRLSYGDPHDTEGFRCFLHSLQANAGFCHDHFLINIHHLTNTMHVQLIQVVKPEERVKHLMFTPPGHCPLSLAIQMQSRPSHPIYPSYVLILSSSILVGLPNGLVASGFLTKQWDN